LPPKPRPRDELFDALAEVTASDPALVGSQLGKLRADLGKADPPYTAEDVREFGRRFLDLCPWAAEDGRTTPTLGELRNHLGKLRAKAGSGPDRRGTRSARVEGRIYPGDPADGRGPPAAPAGAERPAAGPDPAAQGSGPEPGHATVRTRIRKFLASSEPRWPLVIWGAVGCGKSCAALCLADRVPGAYCLTLRELVDLIMESRAGKLWRDAGPGEGMIRVSEWAIWRQLDRAPLVILDELGTRKAGDLEYEALKRTLDKREGRPMVCVSNHAPADLARLFDARISDRLEGGTVIEYPGGSRRR
jgi:hypothetical protein